jgi:hypothetical protein
MSVSPCTRVQREFTCFAQQGREITGWVGQSPIQRDLKPFIVQIKTTQTPTEFHDICCCGCSAASLRVARWTVASKGSISNILTPRSKRLQCANPCLTLLSILLERHMSMRLRKAARVQQQSPRISRAQAINLSCSQASSVSYQFSRKRTHPQIPFLHVTRR